MNKSLVNNINKLRVFTSATLSNSSCILLSTISEIFPAPLLATSIAAPTATLESRPAGVNFLALIILLPQINIPVFKALPPVSFTIAVSFVWLLAFSLLANLCSQDRTESPVSATLRSLLTSCFSTALSILRILPILKMSKKIQKNRRSRSKAPAKFGTSDHDCHPIGSKINRTSRTISGGNNIAKISFAANKPKPFTGNSRTCFSAHPACGASFLIAFLNGTIKNIRRKISGIQMIIDTYASQGPAGGKSGMLIG